MNALIWKKFKWITQNIKTFSYFFIVPIGMAVWLFFSTNNKDALICYFPFIATVTGILFDQMDIENITNKGYALYTPISLKKAWIYNALISWGFRFIYSIIIMTLGLFLYEFIHGSPYVTFATFLKGILNGFSAFGIVLFSTQYEVDFARVKQYFAFAWIIPVLLCVAMCENSMSAMIPTDIFALLYIFVFSAFLMCIALIINKNVSAEKFILSLEKIRKIVSARFNVIDE